MKPMPLFRRLAPLAAALILWGCEQKPETTSTTTTASPAASSEAKSPTTSATDKAASNAPPTAAPKSTNEGGPVVLGVAGPFTGNNAEFGVQIRMGVELAAEELNKAGGINGRQVKLEIGDDQGSGAEAQNVATKFSNNPDMVAVIGHFNSSCSLAGKGTYTEAKMVMFSPGSTNVDVTKNSDYVYRNIFTDEFQGQSLANYAGNVLKAKTVAILFDNDDYGKGLKDSFTNRAKQLGLNIAQTTAYGKDTNDFRSQLETVRGANADVLLIAGLYNHAAVIAKQAKELGIKTQLMGGDGVFSQEFINLAGDSAEGAFITCPFLFDLSGERGKKFSEIFKAKYNREPDAWAALSYDAFNIIADGLKKNGVSREAVLKHLQGINSAATAFDGLTGKTYFDAEGDCKKPVQVSMVKGGKFVAAEKQLSPEGTAMSSSEMAGGSAATAATTPAAAPAPANTPSPEPAKATPDANVTTGTVSAAPANPEGVTATAGNANAPVPAAKP